MVAGVDFELKFRIFPEDKTGVHADANEFLKTIIPIGGGVYFKDDGRVIVIYREKDKEKKLSDLTEADLKEKENEMAFDTIAGFKDQHYQNNIANRFNIIKYSTSLEYIRETIKNTKDKKTLYELEKEEKELETKLKASEEAYASNEKDIITCDMFLKKYIGEHGGKKK